MLHHRGPAIEWHGALDLEQLSEVGAGYVLHRVPQQAGAASDPVDAHDVGVIELGRELSFSAKPFHHFRVRRQIWMEDLERHLSLQAQVSHAVDAPKASDAEFIEQLVLVPEGSTQLPLPRFWILLGRARRRDSDGCLELPHHRRQVLRHLCRAEVSIAGVVCQGTQQQAIEDLGCGAAKLAGWPDLSWVGRRRLAGDGEIQQRAHAVDVARRFTVMTVPGFRGQKRDCGFFLIGLRQLEATVGVSEIGNDRPLCPVHQHGGRNDPA